MTWKLAQPSPTSASRGLMFRFHTLSLESGVVSRSEGNTQASGLVSPLDFDMILVGMLSLDPEDFTGAHTTQCREFDDHALAQFKHPNGLDEAPLG